MTEADPAAAAKDVYSAMAPATYTRTLGSGVGRSPTTIEPLRHRPALTAAIKRMRRRREPVDGSKALSDARARMETKTDPEVLEIYRGARAETKVHHVRTPAGVRRYHAPIGTPIVGGHAVVSLPSAGGGRMRAGRNAGRATSGLVGGSSRRGSTGGRGGFTGRSRRGLGGSSSNPFSSRRRGGGTGRRGRNLPGNGFNGGGGGLGGLSGFGLGSIFGGGKQPAAGPKPKKPPKAKQPKKTPPKAKKPSSSRGSGVGRGSLGKGPSSTKPKTTPAKPSQGQVDQAAQQLLLLPPDRLNGVLHTMPYGVLGPLLRTIQDPKFQRRVSGVARGSGNAPAVNGAKSLSIAAAWLESKDPQPAHGDERCPACGVDLDDSDYYDTVPTGKGYELVVCVPCAAETKAGGRGSGDSGVPGHLPEQLRRYWTRGKGAAQWIGSAHPYTSLVRALSEEEIPRRMIHGLAANLFKDVYGIFPAQRPRALGGSTHGYAR